MTDAEGNPEFHHQYQNQALYHQRQQQMQMQKQQLMPTDESLIKLKRLDEINASIVKISQTLISFFDELANDKRNQKPKVTKQLFEEFLKHLKKVESDLLNEIQALRFMLILNDLKSCSLISF